MKSKVLFLSGIVFSSAISLLTGCAGSSSGENLEVPTNLPPICRDIDFVEQPDMREMCGVRTVKSRAYKNIPQQRYLIKPQETSIVKSGNMLELRFQNSLPLYLDGPIVDEMEFSQEKRLQKIKNTYDYHEIYNRVQNVSASSRWASPPTRVTSIISASAFPKRRVTPVLVASPWVTISKL